MHDTTWVTYSFPRPIDQFSLLRSAGRRRPVPIPTPNARRLPAVLILVSAGRARPRQCRPPVVLILVTAARRMCSSSSLPAAGSARPRHACRQSCSSPSVVGSLFEYPTVVIPGSRQEHLPYDEGPTKAQEGRRAARDSRR